MYEKVWLAGLGAYGRSEKLGKEGAKLFDELVHEGADVRNRASGKLEDLKLKAKEKIQTNAVRIKELLRLEPHNGDIAALSRQVEELSAAINALALAPQTGKKTTDKHGKKS